MVAVSSKSQTIGQLVTERPARARIFEAFGIDYCCGGKKPLSQACAELGLNLQTVAGVLAAFDEQAQADGDNVDWSRATLSELCDHIEHTHHAYLKDELPRLEFLINKVSGKHGERDRRLVELRGVFAAFKGELELHMAKEERILFPACRELSAAQTLPDFHCQTLDNPISVMIAEHDDAGNALKRMRELTDDYTPPAEACNTYRATLDSLAALERDMHRHVHKENSILFPAALDAEHRLRSLRSAHLTI